MKAVHKRRLLKLAKFLRKKVPVHLLDMRTWMGYDKNGHIHRHASLECGTPACAAGWATAIFPELYFSIVHRSIELRGRRSRGNAFDALMVFFGLNDDQADELFAGYHHRTPDEEADLLEEVARKG